MMTAKDILSAITTAMLAVMLAGAIVVALDYTFRPEPQQLDPLAPLHLSDKWP